MKWYRLIILNESLFKKFHYFTANLERIKWNYTIKDIS